MFSTDDRFETSVLISLLLQNLPLLLLCLFIRIKKKIDLIILILYLQLDLDGRDITVPGYETGNFVGPTIISRVKVNTCCYFT